MQIVNVQQGTPEWHALRAKYFTASEAPVMMAASSKMRRDELLHMKATGSEREVSDWVQKNLFDKGHACENSARDIVEKIIGQELFPATAIDDSGQFLASFDGITMLEDIIFEHKMWNEKLADAVRANELPPEYYWQLEQQLLVSGAQKAIFVVSDGTEDNFVHIFYSPVSGRQEQLIAGWAQFESDLAIYKVPTIEADSIKGKALMRLPTLVIEIEGAVKQSNLAVYETEALSFIKSINTELSTDQDFADAEQTVKFCEKAEKELDAIKKKALSQTEQIDTLFRTIDLLCEEMRNKRLTLNKLVKNRKDEIRQEIINQAKSELAKHYKELNDQLTGITLPFPDADFVTVIKGKKTVTTLRSAANDELARAKIECSQLFIKYQANMQLFEQVEPQYRNLFNDQQLLMNNEYEHLELLIKQRIHDQQEADHKAKLQKEEAEKATTQKSDGETISAPQTESIQPIRRASSSGNIKQPANIQKSVLIELVDSDSAEDDDGNSLTVIHREHIDSRRWESVHMIVFNFKDKLYSSTYRLGLTECQESCPYEYEPDVISCPAMEAYQVTITRYRPIA